MTKQTALQSNINYYKFDVSINPDLVVAICALTIGASICYCYALHTDANSNHETMTEIKKDSIIFTSTHQKSTTPQDVPALETKN